MKALFLTALAGVAVSSSAFGGTQTWNYNGVSPSQNANAGTISNIASTYNTTSEVFTWDVTYSNGATKDTDGDGVGDACELFTGDIQQIDHPYLDTLSNGLSYLIDRMVGQNLFAHVTLEKGERSELAELASNLL